MPALPRGNANGPSGKTPVPAAAVPFASAGAVVGLCLAAVLLTTFVKLAPASLPRLAEASLDLRFLTAAAVLTLGCTFLFGLAPFASQRSRWFRPGLAVV